jgi:hypothetical protein
MQPQTKYKLIDYFSKHTDQGEKGLYQTVEFNLI